MLFDGRRQRIGAAVLRHRQADALETLLHREVGAPLPCCDCEMNFRRLRRDADLLRAAPGDRADVAVGELVGLDHVAADLIDLGDRVRHLEVERGGAVDEALRMLAQLEDGAVVGAQALEHAATVVQRMRQDVNVGLTPRDHLAVEPDKTVTIVKRGWPRHAYLSPWTFAPRSLLKAGSVKRLLRCRCW